MYLFSGSSNTILARKVTHKAGFKYGKIELSRFDNDEARVRILENNIGDECVVFQSLSEPTDHHLVELLLMCDALKRMGVGKITGVVPWLGYSKQDKVFIKGEPLSIGVIAQILEVAGMSQLVTIDLHSQRIKDYFRIPVQELTALNILATNLKVDKETVVVSPDEGSKIKSKKLAGILNCPVVYLDKKRDLQTGKVKILGIKGELRNKKVIIIDDMIATGGTLIETAKFLRSRGVQLIKVLVTHHLYVSSVQEKLSHSMIDELVVTDTVEPKKLIAKLKVVSVADELAKQIGG